MTLAGLLGAAAAAAQTSPRPPGEVPFLNFPGVTPAPKPPPEAAPPPPAETPAASDSKGAPNATLKQRDQDLQAVRAEQKKARETEAKLRQEIDRIGADRRKLNRQLIDVATRVRTVEGQIAATEERLAPLDQQDRDMRAAFDRRRETIANVLAALQRIGRHPPAVLLVAPEDALQSLRSAMLLGAVLPEMRQEVERLLTELAALADVRRKIATERTALEASLASLAEDRLRMSMLTEQRQKQQSDAESTLAAERKRAAGLARQAEDLQGLITQLEQGLDRTTRASRVAARRADEKQSTDARAVPAALNDPGRLEPAVAFARAKGILPLPVNGVRIREFGTPDGLGGNEKGLSLATRPGAQITAPCDGWVVYAGPFRNYGQLLILNAGDGYHVLLAGMERISVDLGQFVLTGEPVAIMGGRVQAPAAIATGSGQPVLYVEFRKDGTPVDPTPWWAASDSEKVRG